MGGLGGLTEPSPALWAVLFRKLVLGLLSLSGVALIAQSLPKLL